jgi:CheY-like chemotaxis protein
MSLVLWIDQNSFSTNLVEKVFKKKGLPFYSLSKATDLSYLVEDIKPSLIVLDGETARANLAEFLEEFKQSIYLQKTPFILIMTFPNSQG